MTHKYTGKHFICNNTFEKYSFIIKYEIHFFNHSRASNKQFHGFKIRILNTLGIFIVW